MICWKLALQRLDDYAAYVEKVMKVLNLSTQHSQLLDCKISSLVAIFVTSSITFMLRPLRRQNVLLLGESSL